MPTVSIIIPTFNRGNLLPAAIESARHAGSDSEIIVVDDGSTDNTREVCKEFADIRYLRLERNAGLANARNIGVLASSAQFVTFLDDDDRRLPGSLDSQLNALQARPDAAFCYGRVVVVDALRHLPTGEMLPERCPTGDIFWDLMERNFVPVNSVVALRTRLIKRNLFTASLRAVEDWDLWLRMTEAWPVVAIEEPVATYRRATSESGQMCSDMRSIWRQMFRVQKRALELTRARSAPIWKRKLARLRLIKLAYNALLFEEAAITESKRGARQSFPQILRLRPFYRRAGLNLFRLLRSG